MLRVHVFDAFGCRSQRDSQRASQPTSQPNTQPASRPSPRGNRASAIMFVAQKRPGRTGALCPQKLEGLGVDFLLKGTHFRRTFVLRVHVFDAFWCPKRIAGSRPANQPASWPASMCHPVGWARISFTSTSLCSSLSLLFPFLLPKIKPHGSRATDIK